MSVALKVYGADSISSCNFVHIGSSISLRAFGRLGGALSVTNLFTAGSSYATD